MQPRDLLRRVLDASLTLELDRYLLVSRRDDGWDALVAILTVLDRDQNPLLSGLLERCCAASAESLDDEGGLLAVLTSAETLEADAAADREHRRARQGYVSPADARAFLALASAANADELLAQRDADPLTRAYFRERDARIAAQPPAPRAAAPDSERAEDLLGALREAEILPSAQPLLAAGEPELDVLRAGLARLADLDPDAHAQRMDELSYLANVLIAGAGSGRAYRPVEAVLAVIEACTQGLAHLLGGPARRRRPPRSRTTAPIDCSSPAGGCAGVSRAARATPPRAARNRPANCMPARRSAAGAPGGPGR